MRRYSLQVTWGALWLLSAGGRVAAQSPLPPGPFRVGFAVETIGKADPLQLATWYPAAKGGTPLVYGDLLDLVALETSPSRGEIAARTATAQAKYLAFMAAVGLDSLAIGRLRSTAMAARRGAGPLAGTRPLVIIVQGNGQPVADQAILAEFLASHGFVVATSPSVTRRRGPPPSADSIGPSAERQADDVARVVRRVSQRYGVDPRRVGLIGHSFGARGALLFQMRGRAVRALVSLDGGIGTATGTASMLTAPSYSSTRGGVPVLHFFETLSAAMAPDWVFLRTLRGPVTVAKVEGMRHHHFTDLGGLVGQLPALARATQATSGTAAGYRAVAEATLTFLERRLRRSPGGAMGVAVSVDSLLTMTPLSQVDR